MEVRIPRFWLVLLCLLSGCDPYHFTMKSSSSLDGTILSQLGTVNTHYYTVELLPNAAVELTNTERTQFQLATYIRLSHGEGFQVLLRPTVEDKLLDSGLVLTFFTKGGMRLDSAGITLIENKNFHFPVDSDALLRVYNEQAYVEAIVGCDTLVKHFSTTIATDDLVFTSLDNSTVTITIPEWNKVRFPKGEEIYTGGMPIK